MKKALNDPDSAKFQNERAPTRGKDVWCGEVNARNRMGGMVGFTRYIVTFSDSSAKDEVVLDPSSNDRAPWWYRYARVADVGSEDPWEAAQRLTSELGLLNIAQLEQIRTLTLRGERTAAWALLSEKVRDRVAEHYPLSITAVFNSRWKLYCES